MADILDQDMSEEEDKLLFGDGPKNSTDDFCGLLSGELEDEDDWLLDAEGYDIAKPQSEGINRGTYHWSEVAIYPESSISTDASRNNHASSSPSPATAMMATTQKPFSDFNFPRKKSLIVPSHATSWMSRSGSSRGEEVTSSCPPSRARETSNYQPDSRITAPSCFDPDVEAFPATSSRKPIGTPVCEGWQENLSKFRVKSGGSNIIKLNAPGKFRYVREELLPTNTSLSSLVEAKKLKVGPGDLRQRLRSNRGSGPSLQL